MANSHSGSVATYAITSGGAPIPSAYEILSIRIEQCINRISTATITILDGNPSEGAFPVSSSATFIPGAEISISLGYDNTNTSVFSGIVTKQSLQLSDTSGPVLEIECKDKAIKMTVGRKSAGYSKSTDSSVITTLIGNSSGLTASVASTTPTLPELVQYYTSDWDFMLARAEVNSMLVSTINGTVKVFDPTTVTTSVLTLTYGLNIFGFHADLNSVTQYAQVKASAWDYSTQKLINATAPNNLAGPGNITSKTLSGVIGLDNFELQTTAAESSDELTAWAKGQMLKSELAKIIGEVRSQGNSLVIPGSYITLAGLGARFDGDHFVSSVQHELSDGNWLMDVNIGMSPAWFVQENEVEAPPAAGLLPGISGLFNATVKQIDSDPDSEYRILVDVALFNDKDTGLWARLANFYSTNGQGVFFLPEVGDEVILGFLNQDPRFPVILGSMYSKVNKPFSIFTPDKKNPKKGIVSKSSLEMVFDDENIILSLITPNKNTVVLDDKNKQVEVKDQNGNSILMSSDGITIKSPKTITLQADQKVVIKGSTGMDIEASGGDVTIKGNNINETAQMQYVAKGSMTAEVQGGTELILKAAMVMIN